MRKLQLTAIIEREEEQYVAFCTELDIASQGDTVEEARLNLIESFDGFYEVADPSEVESRRETAIASEQALAKDWLKPEEDAAWQDL